MPAGAGKDREVWASRPAAAEIGVAKQRSAEKDEAVADIGCGKKGTRSADQIKAMQ